MATQIPADQAAQLRAALGEGDVEALGDTQITPIRVKQFSGILRCLGKLSGSIDFHDWKNIDFFSLITSGGDDAIELVAEAITQEPDPLKRPAAVKAAIVTVGNLDLLEMAKILGGWFKVNQSFFVQNQVAFLEAFGIPAETATVIFQTLSEFWNEVKQVGTAEVEKAKATAVGPASSSSSSPTDTASTTSANTP